MLTYEQLEKFSDNPMYMEWFMIYIVASRYITENPAK